MKRSLLFGVLLLGITYKILQAEAIPSIEDALHPITFTSSKHDDYTRIAFKYATSNDTTAYWIYSKSRSLSPITTQGEIEVHEEGDQTYAVSSIELDNMPEDFFGTTQLTFVVATSEGDIIMDIYNPRQLGNVEEEMSKTEMKANVPNTIETTVTADNNGKHENLTIVIEYIVKEKTGTDLQVRGTYDLENGIKLREVSYFDTKESFTDTATMRVYSIPQHRIRHSEEFTFGLDHSGSVTKNQFISSYQYYRGVIHPHDGPKNSPIVFINSSRLFKAESYYHYRGAGEYPLMPDRVLLQDGDKYRTVSCAAYGYPKPSVYIRHPGGRVLDHVDLQKTSSLTTHVMAKLDPQKSVKEIAGNYTCEASNDHALVTRTITVERVVQPSVVHFGIIRNDDVMVVAECEVTGTPIPKILFLVNGESSVYKYFGRRGRRGRVTLKQFDTADGLSRINILTITGAGRDAKSLSCEASESSVFDWIRDRSKEIYI